MVDIAASLTFMNHIFFGKPLFFVLKNLKEKIRNFKSQSILGEKNAKKMEPFKNPTAAATTAEGPGVGA